MRRSHRLIAVVVAAAAPAAAVFASVTTPAHAAPSVQTTFPIVSSTHTSAHCGSCGYKPTGIVTGPDGNIWVSEQNNPYIERLTPSGSYTSYYADAPMPINGVYSTCSNQSWAIAVGPDSNLWFTKDCYLDPSNAQSWFSQIGMITPSGTVTRFTLPGAVAANAPPPYVGPQPYGITAGPDGNLWFTEQGYNNIGQITTSGTVTLFPVPTANSGLDNIVNGPDGNLWFAENAASKIGRVTPAGVITEFPLSANAQPTGIVAGPDGNIWFTETGLGKVGRLSTSGSNYTEFTIPTANSQPMSITTSPDGALWFAESGATALGRITTGGAITEYATPYAPFGVASGPQGIWYTASNNDVVGRLPQVTCADLTTSISTPSGYGGQRAAPGDQVTFNATTTNCGTPALTNVSTATTVASPAGCPQAPAVPTSTATLAYGQTSSQHVAFAAPSCVGDYVFTSRSSAGGSQITSTTTDYVVSNGGGSRIAGDFNGDGYADVAIANPDGASCGPNGAVTVYYGSPAGISSAGTQCFSALSPGMPPGLQFDPNYPTNFGLLVSAADFDRDGYSDLAISVCCWKPFVVVLHGSRAGLTTSASQEFAPPPSVQNGYLNGYYSAAEWGSSFATGDFNGDGYPDLAVGAPRDFQVSNDGGSVTVLFGSATGLGSAQVLTKRTPGMPGPQPAFDEFGFTLAAGDFNHDGFDDLAITAHTEMAVYQLRGSASGVTTTNSEFLASLAPEGGFSLAVGDFNGDGFKDLAVGDIDPSFTAGSGWVEIHYGTATGLGSVKFKSAQRLSPSSLGMPAAPAPVYGFAMGLAAGDFNHDGHDDLIIAAYGFGQSGSPYIGGGVYMLKGGGKKVTTTGSKLIMTPVGWANIATGDINGDGYMDLLQSSGWSGATSVYDGSTTFLPKNPSQTGLAYGRYSFPGSIDLWI